MITSEHWEKVGLSKMSKHMKIQERLLAEVVEFELRSEGCLRFGWGKSTSFKLQPSVPITCPPKCVFSPLVI